MGRNAKEKTERTVLTLPITTEKWQEDLIRKRMEIARLIYNAMLAERLKELRKMEDMPGYRRSRAIMYEEASAGRKKSDRYKAATVCVNNAMKEYGFSEFSFLGEVATFAKPYLLNIGSCMAANSVAKPLWRAFEKYFFSNGKRMCFKSFGDVRSLVTDGNSGMVLVDGSGHKILCVDGYDTVYLLFGVHRHKVMRFPIDITGLNAYEREQISKPVKQIRILRKTIRGRDRFFVQFCLEGLTAVKRDASGEPVHFTKDSGVGVYVTTTRVGVATTEGIKEYGLDEGVPDYSDEIAELGRYMDASRRATNPDNFNPDGTIKKES